MFSLMPARHLSIRQDQTAEAGWRLEAGGWRLEAGGWRLERPWQQSTITAELKLHGLMISKYFKTKAIT